MIQLPESGFVRLPQIIGDKKHGIPAVIPVSKSAWWAGVASGRFPKAIKLGPRTTVWSVDSIRALIENPKAYSESSKPSALELAGQA